MPITVTEYHERTKHRLDGYARGPESLDWDRQPIPFRWYDESPQLPLPLAADQLATTFGELDAPAVVQRPWDRASLGLLLEISMGLSAWKQFGSARWALRCNPSSGNLHPTESYLLVSGIAELHDGLYHYRPDAHALELRCRLASVPAPHPVALLGLSSVHWREAWKYGERAYRYCQLDAGHAAAAVSFAAAAVGRRVRPLYHLGDAQLARLLGLDREAEFYPDESEHPELLLALTETDERDLHSLLERCAGGQWYGNANRLDPRHDYAWPVLDEVTSAAQHPATAPTVQPSFPGLPPRVPSPNNERAADLFRRRRSAQAFDGTTVLDSDAFFRILDSLLPRAGIAPWDTQPWAPHIHLPFFVHRVSGLAPGLYLLLRNADSESVLRESLRNEFAWERVTTAPGHLPLFRLISARAERTAARLACGQAIAAEGAFSAAMLADFAADLSAAPWRYRERHWEAGTIGQVLYLEAEAAGVRGTGIGCFFDDAMHELLGINEPRWKVLYCFTVGTPLHDQRLITLPPYSTRQKGSE